MDKALVEFLDSIHEYQLRRDISDRKFARIIGIDHSLLSRIKVGKSKPGGKFLRGVSREIPELRYDVAIYMVHSEPVEALNDTLANCGERYFSGLRNTSGDVYQKRRS